MGYRNLNDLAAAITRAEGKKESISIAQVREVLGIVADHCYASAETALSIYLAGERRARKALKAKPRTTRK